MKRVAWLYLIFLLFLSCEKSGDNNEITSLVNTKWKLIQFIDTTGNISIFPSEIDDFEIVFRTDGEFDLVNLCNYSYGDYLTNNDAIFISNIGAGTEMYCLPDELMDWESLLVKSMVKAESYQISDNELTINCSDCKLVFDFISTYGSDVGKVLFCTNSHIMNCVFSIDISVDGENKGTLDASSIYSDADYYCDNSGGIGLLLSLNEGKYEYSAQETHCVATNATSLWKGSFTVVADTCMVVFLDIALK